MRRIRYVTRQLHPLLGIQGIASRCTSLSGARRRAHAQASELNPGAGCILVREVMLDGTERTIERHVMAYNYDGSPRGAVSEGA